MSSTISPLVPKIWKIKVLRANWFCLGIKIILTKGPSSVYPMFKLMTILKLIFVLRHSIFPSSPSLAALFNILNEDMLRTSIVGGYHALHCIVGWGWSDLHSSKEFWLGCVLLGNMVPALHCIWVRPVRFAFFITKLGRAQTFTSLSVVMGF